MFHEVKSMLINTLNEIQTMSGRESTNITGDTCPMVDLDGFDSLNATEAIASISVELGCDLEPSMIIGDLSSPMTINEITTTIIRKLN